ncbi:uncharacterized protein CCOS01_02891, partial [Colletotrichum costaricense]
RSSPCPQTATQVLQQERLQQHRIHSFLNDNDGPKTMLSHAPTSPDESMAKHRAEVARKIEDITSNFNG